MADDLGYGGIGCYGNQSIQTPNLDHMAQNGLKLTSYYANSAVCSPTRAALMTGRYQQRSGMEGVIYVRGESRKLGMALDQVTLPEMLKSKGYSTGIMGKWHLGYDNKFNPIQQGFDTFYGYRSGNIDFHTHYDNAGIFDWYHGEDTLNEQGYVTDLITKHSIDFIKGHQHQPFFLYVAHQAPHAPFQGRNDPGYRYPDSAFSYYGPVEDKHAAYREMVEVMDEGIGAILETLKELKLETNTLVVFVSDNGAEADYGDNGSLRGHKTTLFEGGIKVPGLVYWPGTIDVRESNQSVMSFDWMPTFMSLAQVPLPESLKLDGMDLSEFLLSRDPLPERNLFWRYREQKVIQEKKYKLLLSKDSTYLFDLERDATESQNLAPTRSDLVADLTEKLSAWEQEIDGNYRMITR
jgi:arylsulfatase A-like enzyme